MRVYRVTRLAHSPNACRGSHVHGALVNGGRSLRVSVDHTVACGLPPHSVIPYTSVCMDPWLPQRTPTC